MLAKNKTQLFFLGCGQCPLKVKIKFEVKYMLIKIIRRHVPVSLVHLVRD